MDTVNAQIPSPFDEKVGFSLEAVVEQVPAPYIEETRIAQGYASEKRKREFYAGRRACHKALSQIAIQSVPILKKPSGEPSWPEGVVGSISHSGGSAVAAVCLASSYSGLGIDIEFKHQKRNPKVLDRILFEKELVWTRGEDAFQKKLSVFSAKEACYKAFYQKYQIKLSWSDVIFTPSEDTLIGRLTRDWDKEREVEVKMRHSKDYLICGIALV